MTKSIVAPLYKRSSNLASFMHTNSDFLSLPYFLQHEMADKTKVSAGHDGTPNGVDMAAYPTAQKLAARSLEFLKEVQNL